MRGPLLISCLLHVIVVLPWLFERKLPTPVASPIWIESTVVPSLKVGRRFRERYGLPLVNEETVKGEAESRTVPFSVVRQYGNEKPKYPAVALENGWGGVVELAINLETSGKVLTAEVIKGSGYAVLDRSALIAAYGWNFPGHEGRVQVPVEFVLEKE